MFSTVGGDAGHAEHYLGDLPVGRAAGAAVKTTACDGGAAGRRHAQICGRRRMEPAKSA